MSEVFHCLATAGATNESMCGNIPPSYARSGESHRLISYVLFMLPDTGRCPECNTIDLITPTMYRELPGDRVICCDACGYRFQLAWPATPTE